MENNPHRRRISEVREQFINDVKYHGSSLLEDRRKLLDIHLYKLYWEPEPKLDDKQYHEAMVRTILMMQFIKDYLFDGVEYFREIWGFGKGIYSQEFLAEMNHRLSSFDEQQKNLAAQAVHTMDAQFLAAHGDYPLEIVKFIQRKKIEITDAVRTVNRQFKAKYNLTKDEKLKTKVLMNWKSALGIVGT